jgi:molecular chaperone GrpE
MAYTEVGFAVGDEKNNANGSGSGADSTQDQTGPIRLSDSLAQEAKQESKTDAAALDPVAVAKAEADKFRSEFLYARAELENFKRQVVKERSDLRKYGSERLVVDLLTVLDIFETAMATPVSAETLDNFRKGIEMTASELRGVLQRHGVEEIPAHGKPFDPASHEALTSEETDEHPPGSITRVFKKPYKLHDRLIRPGQVVVAKPKG